ncbi:MAG: aminotransferase class I/II-fold pyridoxal phosphate-dependent enzyme [Clostridia bacterium]|nr:aminotransferase class I/II-fold pyridoxal phosphate-dependent enzyme [Clostridia bacterium]MDE7265775.1 aminotransferase class I/II-fold pyridoxal phosphate-dependent enzyme [Clostridia bacterium]
MYDYLIYSRLKKAGVAQKTFHIPGHKDRGEFKKLFPVSALDVTELPYSDNLHNPDEVIAAAQRDIAEILGAGASFITTDGSSSGVYAMLYAAAQRGNKIIVLRNSHQSVWTGCRLLGLEPLIVQGEEVEGILTFPDLGVIEGLIAADTKIAGVLVTSPDYYGNIAPLEQLSAITKNYNRLLLVDEAHGAHLAFGDKKGYAGLYADAWVDGAHKTLPTLTQGAILNVNNSEIYSFIEEGINMFRTTSPSYPIMASVEYGVKYLANNPAKVQTARLAVETFVKECEGNLPVVVKDDWTKLLIDFKPLGISAETALNLLEKKGTYAELCDGRYILFYLSPMVDLNELRDLKKKLIPITENKKLAGTFKDKPAIPSADRSYSFLYALKKPCELVDLEDAVGRMCAKNAGVNPPCIPVIVAGEMISVAAVKTLMAAKHTFGMHEGKVFVVKK